MINNHDQPIKKYENDLLGRQNFVKNLAKSIEQYSGEDSFVIGLYGEWGTGKTSIINMLVDYLQDSKNQISQNKSIIVKFNPWYFSGQDHLIKQFFNVLISNLDSSIEKMGKELKDGLSTVGKSMKKFAEILEPVNKFVVPFIPIPLLGETSEKLQEIMKSVGSAMVGDSNEPSSDPIKLKKNISEQLKKIDRKILIIIDDIDRLSKNEIKQIFQLVKSLADFPNTIYLLSFSPEVVTQSLEEIQGGDSRKYLEKVVQYPIEIPFISQRNLENFLYSGVSEVVATKNLDQNLYESQWIEYIFNELNLRFYFTNIREIIRFLNIFRFNFDLVGEEVNTVDLIVVSAIQSLDTKLYSFLKNNKEKFVGGKDKKHQNDLLFEDRLRRINSGHQEIKELENNLLHSISFLENNKSFYRQYDYIKPSLDFLFGQSEKLTCKSVGKRRSIGHIDYFDYYFQLSLPDNKVSYLEINQLLDLVHNPDQFLDYLENYTNSEKLSSLIHELNININRLFLDNQLDQCKLLNDLIIFGDKLNSETVYPILDKVIDNHFYYGEDEQKYLAILKHLFGLSPNHLSLSYLLLLQKFAKKFFLYKQDDNRDIGKINEYKYANDFIQLENMILDKIKNNVDNQKIFESRYIISFLTFWEQFETQTITQKVTDLINMDKSYLLKVLISCCTDDRHLYKSLLNKFINDQDCLKQIKNIKQDKIYWNSLNELEKQSIDKAYDTIINSSKNKET